MRRRSGAGYMESDEFGQTPRIPGHLRGDAERLYLERADAVALVLIAAAVAVWGAAWVLRR